MTLLATNWPHVWFVTLLGFGLVFVLLVVLIYVLKLFGRIMQPRVKTEKPQEVLHLYYNGVHDEEPTHITIKKIERKYSPWNAKIMGMNNLHRN